MEVCARLLAQREASHGRSLAISSLVYDAQSGNSPSPEPTVPSAVWSRHLSTTGKTRKMNDEQKKFQPEPRNKFLCPLPSSLTHRLSHACENLPHAIYTSSIPLLASTNVHIKPLHGRLPSGLTVMVQSPCKGLAWWSATRFSPPGKTLGTPSKCPPAMMCCQIL